MDLLAGAAIGNAVLDLVDSLAALCETVEVACHAAAPKLASLAALVDQVDKLWMCTGALRQPPRVRHCSGPGAGGERWHAP